MNKYIATFILGISIVAGLITYLQDQRALCFEPNTLWFSADDVVTDEQGGVTFWPNRCATGPDSLHLHRGESR